MGENVIVIGAGMGGLATAIDLQSKGYQVSIYEKNNIPGGKMSQIKSNGFTFDVGPSLVMMPEIYEQVFEKAGKNSSDYIEMIHLDPAVSVYYENDMSVRLDVSSDFSKLMPMLEKIDQKDAHGFLKYLENIYGRYQIARDHFITKSFNSWTDFYNIPTIYQALQLKTFNSADASIGKYVKNRYIKQMLSFQTLYIGVSPQKGPSLYSIIPMIELLYGVKYLRGGMHTMAEGMARCFEEIGGVIHYDAPVQEILIDTPDKKVQGIVLENGETVLASKVVANADFPYAVQSLIREEKIKGKYTDKKLNEMKYSCSCFVMYIECNRKFEDIEVHNFVIADELEENLDAIFSGKRIEDPSFYIYSASQIDKTMAPEGKDGLYILVPVSELSIAEDVWNEETINYYKEAVLQKMERHESFKDIRQSIAHMQYYTPNDFEEKFHAYNGACFGFQPILSQSNHLRPQSKALDCEGLYFCGSSTHPGAGVPIAIQSGYLAAEAVVSDDTNKK